MRSSAGQNMAITDSVVLSVRRDRGNGFNRKKDEEGFMKVDENMELPFD